MAVLDVCSVFGFGFDLFLEVSVFHQFFVQRIDQFHDFIIVVNQLVSLILRDDRMSKDNSHVFSKFPLDGFSKLVQNSLRVLPSLSLAYVVLTIVYHV